MGINLIFFFLLFSGREECTWPPHKTGDMTVFISCQPPASTTCCEVDHVSLGLRWPFLRHAGTVALPGMVCMEGKVHSA